MQNYDFNDESREFESGEHWVRISDPENESGNQFSYRSPTPIEESVYLEDAVSKAKAFETLYEKESTEVLHLVLLYRDQMKKGRRLRTVFLQRNARLRSRVDILVERETKKWEVGRLPLANKVERDEELKGVAHVNLLDECGLTGVGLSDPTSPSLEDILGLRKLQADYIASQILTNAEFFDPTPSNKLEHNLALTGAVVTGAVFGVLAFRALSFIPRIVAPSWIFAIIVGVLGVFSVCLLLEKLFREFGAEPTASAEHQLRKRLSIGVLAFAVLFPTVADAFGIRTFTDDTLKTVVGTLFMSFLHTVNYALAAKFGHAEGQIKLTAMLTTQRAVNNYEGARKAAVLDPKNAKKLSLFNRFKQAENVTNISVSELNSFDNEHYARVQKLEASVPAGEDDFLSWQDLALKRHSDTVYGTARELERAIEALNLRIMGGTR